MRIDEAIGTDPGIMSGALCFLGTRVPVRNLFDHLEAGDPLDAFFDGFPRVSREQVHVVLQASYRLLESPAARQAA